MTMSLRRIDSGSAVTTGRAAIVIKGRVLAEASEAHGVIERAQREAARVLDEAHVRAEALAEEHLRDREEALAQRQADLEERLWRSAADYAEAVAQEWERSLANMETGATALVSTAVSRLVERVPADDRLRACIKELVAQAGSPDCGVLLVSDQDHAAVLATADRLPWPVQRSGEVATGAVRLVCTQGRWDCDVGSALERLLDALGGSLEERAGTAVDQACEEAGDGEH